MSEEKMREFEALLSENEWMRKLQINLDRDGTVYPYKYDTANFLYSMYLAAPIAPPSAQVIETAAIMKCVELCRAEGDSQKRVFLAPLFYAMATNIEALIPKDGQTQLEEFGWQVAHAILDARREGLLDGNDIRAIVTNLIGVPPLNSETVSGEKDE